MNLNKMICNGTHCEPKVPLTVFARPCCKVRPHCNLGSKHIYALGLVYDILSSDAKEH